ncbi:MAG: hypothetical protein LCH93_16795 [Proteobacteria bacterium]|nr:hypothetical protein [Pseudomonadota bacterium]
MRVLGRSEEGEWWLDLERGGIGAVAFGSRNAISTALLPKRLVVESNEAVLIEEPPPPPFVTETLCEVGATELRLPPDKVMTIAERLYRGGLISLPVTSNPNIIDVEQVWSRISAVGVAWGTRAADLPRRFAAIKEAPEPGGIVPMDWSLPVGGSMAVDEVLYSLIWERALASQMAASRHSIREVEAYSAADERQRFKGSRVDLVEVGWRKFTNRKDWVVRPVNALGGWQRGEVLAVRRIVVEGVDLEMSGTETPRRRSKIN